MTLSFVIPAFNNWKGLHQLLWDIYKNCSAPDEIIVMDDDSTDPDFLQGLTWWIENDLLPIEHVRNVDNVGFLLNSNAGLKRARGDIVCLISTDVRIYKDLVLIGKSIPGVQAAHGNNVLLGGRYLDFDTGWNKFGEVVYPYVEGWLLIATREVWKSCGYFDERFAPNDYEDIDLSTTAVSLGYSLAQITPDGGDGVSHLGAGSIGYTPEREALTNINKRKFEDKWVKKVKA